MNWQIIRAIAEKDLAEVLNNRIAVSGAIVLSIVFAILLPLLITQLPVLTQGSSDQMSVEELIRIIPAELQPTLASLYNGTAPDRPHSRVPYRTPLSRTAPDVVLHHRRGSVCRGKGAQNP